MKQTQHLHRHSGELSGCIMLTQEEFLNELQNQLPEEYDAIYPDTGKRIQAYIDYKQSQRDEFLKEGLFPYLATKYGVSSLSLYAECKANPELKEYIGNSLSIKLHTTDKDILIGETSTGGIQNSIVFKDYLAEEITLDVLNNQSTASELGLNSSRIMSPITTPITIESDPNFNSTRFQAQEEYINALKEIEKAQDKEIQNKINEAKEWNKRAEVLKEVSLEKDATSKIAKLAANVANAEITTHEIANIAQSTQKLQDMTKVVQEYLNKQQELLISCNMAIEEKRQIEAFMRDCLFVQDDSYIETDNNEKSENTSIKEKINNLSTQDKIKAISALSSRLNEIDAHITQSQLLIADTKIQGISALNQVAEHIKTSSAYINIDYEPFKKDLKEKGQDIIIERMDDASFSVAQSKLLCYYHSLELLSNEQLDYLTNRATMDKSFEPTRVIGGTGYIPPIINNGSVSTLGFDSFLKEGMDVFPKHEMDACGLKDSFPTLTSFNITTIDSLESLTRKLQDDLGKKVSELRDKEFKARKERLFETLNYISEKYPETEMDVVKYRHEIQSLSPAEQQNLLINDKESAGKIMETFSELSK